MLRMTAEQINILGQAWALLKDKASEEPEAAGLLDTVADGVRLVLRLSLADDGQAEAVLLGDLKNPKPLPPNMTVAAPGGTFFPSRPLKCICSVDGFNSQCPIHGGVPADG
jgi:hypothetical protein